MSSLDDRICPPWGSEGGLILSALNRLRGDRLVRPDDQPIAVRDVLPIGNRDRQMAGALKFSAQAGGPDAPTCATGRRGSR